MYWRILNISNDPFQGKTPRLPMTLGSEIKLVLHLNPSFPSFYLCALGQATLHATWASTISLEKCVLLNDLDSNTLQDPRLLCSLLYSSAWDSAWH